jgi:hypothetical protein
MDEIFPVLAGVVVGLAIHHIASKMLSAVLVVMASLGLGALASWISGELAVSWAYLLVDAAQVLIAAVLTAALATAWRRRASYRVRF